MLPSVNNNCLCLMGFQGDMNLFSSFCFSVFSYFVCNDHVIFQKKVSVEGRSLRKCILLSDKESSGKY